MKDWAALYGRRTASAVRPHGSAKDSRLLLVTGYMVIRKAVHRPWPIEVEIQSFSVRSVRAALDYTRTYRDARLGYRSNFERKADNPEALGVVARRGFLVYHYPQARTPAYKSGRLQFRHHPRDFRKRCCFVTTIMCRVDAHFNDLRKCLSIKTLIISILVPVKTECLGKTHVNVCTGLSMLVASKRGVFVSLVLRHL